MRICFPLSLTYEMYIIYIVHVDMYIYTAHILVKINVSKFQCNPSYVLENHHEENKPEIAFQRIITSKFKVGRLTESQNIYS